MNVQQDLYEELPQVQASINYLAPGTEQPTIHYCQPPAGTPVSTVVEDARMVPVYDARQLIETFSLARHGIAFIRQESPFDAFDDDATLRRV
jgi:hypothetical protein